jgi:BolA protein
VVIESVAFVGKNRLERQRLVNRALGDIPASASTRSPSRH